jgi:hypothetical protein
VLRRLGQLPGHQVRKIRIPAGHQFKERDERGAVERQPEPRDTLSYQK